MQYAAPIVLGDCTSRAERDFRMCCMQGVYKQVPLDGIWLDMNEVSNYCSGDVCTDPGAFPAPSPFLACPHPGTSTAIVMPFA